METKINKKDLRKIVNETVKQVLNEFFAGGNEQEYTLCFHVEPRQFGSWTNRTMHNNRLETDEIISEAGLCLNDLRKPIKSQNNPEKDGQLRAVTFLEKIEKHDGFVVKGESSKWYVNTENPISKSFIKKIEEVAEGNISVTIPRNIKALIVSDPKYIEFEFEDIPEGCKEYAKLVSLSYFIKTAEFGSTGQTTVGSTADAENLTGFFCAMRAISEVPLTVDLLTRNEYENLYKWGNDAKFFSSDIDKKGLIERATEILSKGGDWLSTFIRTANKLAEEGYLNDGVSIHRNDAFTKSVNSFFKTLEDSYKFSRKDSWSKADIWICNSSDGSEVFQKCSQQPIRTIEQFNEFLRTALRNKLLVGVSLKKLGPEDCVDVVEEFNMDEKELSASHRVSKDDIESARWRKHPDRPVKLNTLEVGKYGISFRCSSNVDTPHPTSFKAIVTVKNAAALCGSVGLSNINHILNKFDKQLPKVRDLNDYLHKQNPLVTGAEISKKMADMFKDIYDSCRAEQQLEIINDILDCALSAKQGCGPFIKIYTKE